MNKLLSVIILLMVAAGRLRRSRRRRRFGTSCGLTSSSARVPSQSWNISRC